MSPETTPAEARRRAIPKLLETEEVTSQAQLLELLAREGIETNQPALSRDLRALGVAKREGRYVLTDRTTPLEELSMLLRDARPAGPNLVVVVCEPGAASAVARALEAEELGGVLGSVAGDDTVFVAVEGAKTGKELRELVLARIEA